MKLISKKHQLLWRNLRWNYEKAKILFAFNISIFLLIFVFPSIVLAQISLIYHTIIANFQGADSAYALEIDGDSLINVFGAGPGSSSITLWKNDGGNPI